MQKSRIHKSENKKRKDSPHEDIAETMEDTSKPKSIIDAFKTFEEIQYLQSQLEEAQANYKKQLKILEDLQVNFERDYLLKYKSSDALAKAVNLCQTLDDLNELTNILFQHTTSEFSKNLENLSRLAFDNDISLGIGHFLLTHIQQKKIMAQKSLAADKKRIIDELDQKLLLANTELANITVNFSKTDDQKFDRLLAQRSKIKKLH
jgi:hypothetical protein